MVKKVQMAGRYTAEKHGLQKLYKLIMGENTATAAMKMKTAIYKAGAIATASLVILAYLLL